MIIYWVCLKNVTKMTTYIIIIKLKKKIKEMRYVNLKKIKNIF